MELSSLSFLTKPQRKINEDDRTTSKQIVVATIAPGLCVMGMSAKSLARQQLLPL
jgi:hypothetical protein